MFRYVISDNISNSVEQSLYALDYIVSSQPIKFSRKRKIAPKRLMANRLHYLQTLRARDRGDSVLTITRNGQVFDLTALTLEIFAIQGGLQTICFTETPAPSNGISTDPSTITFEVDDEELYSDMKDAGGEIPADYVDEYLADGRISVPENKVELLRSLCEPIASKA